MRARKAERRVGGVNGVDSRLTAVNQSQPEAAGQGEDDEGGFDQGNLATSPNDSPEVQASRLAEARNQALREQAAAQEAEEQDMAEEAEEQEESEQASLAQASAQAQAQQQKVDPVLKQAQSRLRWWLWGLALETFGLTILVLDIIYVLHWLAPETFSKLPKPYLWEKIALMALTILLGMAAIVGFVTMLSPLLIPFIEISAAVSWVKSIL